MELKAEEKNTSVEAENKNNNEWKSCCFSVDRKVLSFSVAVLFSAILITFCISQLLDKTNSDDRFSLYISLLTGAVNIWMPTPFMNNNNNN